MALIHDILHPFFRSISRHGVEPLAGPHLTLNMCHAAREKGTVLGEQTTAETNRVRGKPQEALSTQQRSAFTLV